MPQRNIDLLQDAWHAAGRYQRAEHLDPRTQALIAEMFPPVPPHPCITMPKRTPGGYSTAYLDDMGARIMAVIGEHAMNNAEIAERVGVSPKYVGRALTHLVDTGQLKRSTASRWAKARYWKPQVAAGAA